MIAIIDYGMGNLHSVYNALQAIGAQAEIISDPEQLKQADGIILPGVGAFRRERSHHLFGWKDLPHIAGHQLRRFGHGGHR